MKAIFAAMTQMVTFHLSRPVIQVVIASPGSDVAISLTNLFRYSELPAVREVALNKAKLSTGGSLPAELAVLQP